MKREIKFLKGISKVLGVLSTELEPKGHFDKKDTDMLKEIGSSLLAQGGFYFI